MNIDDYTEQTALEIGEAVNARRCTALDVTTAALEQIDRTEPTANAFIHLDPDEARRQAVEVDTKLEAGADLGPLAGVPVSVKDLVHVLGMPTSSGSRLFAGTKAPEDASPVARLRAAGLVIVGKTTTPEFGHKPVTKGALFGETLNPWNRAYTCGGSSGGAAVSLAARQVPLAVGTDGGGSIRIPASVCGVYGLKATLGQIPHVHAADLFANNSYIGPMARTIDDLAAMLVVMAGTDTRDPWSRVGGDHDAHPTGVLRIAYAQSVGNPEIEPKVATAFQRCVEALESLPAFTAGIDIDLASHEPAFRTHLEVMLGGRFGDRLDGSDRDLLDDSFARTLENGVGRTIAEVISANAERSTMYRAIEKLFTDFDLLITPTLAAASVAHDIDTHANVMINNVDCGPIRAGWYPYTFPFNMTGHPAVSMPCGWTSDGLPIGLQIVGPWYSEALILDVARRLTTSIGLEQRTIGDA